MYSPEEVGKLLLAPLELAAGAPADQEFRFERNLETDIGSTGARM